MAITFHDVFSLKIRSATINNNAISNPAISILTKPKLSTVLMALIQSIFPMKNAAPATAIHSVVFMSVVGREKASFFKKIHTKGLSLL